MDGIRDYFMEYLTSMDISQAYVLRGTTALLFSSTPRCVPRTRPCTTAPVSWPKSLLRYVPFSFLLARL